MGKHSGKRQKEKEEERVVTMKALEEMSSDDDDDEMPPEEQWNDEARALKAAIERGAFDHLVMAEKTDTDEESIEEVELDDGSSDGGDSDEGDEPVEKETELAAEESDTDESASSSEDEQQEDKKSKSLKSESSEEEEEEENAGEDHEEKKEMSVEQKNNVNSKALHIVTEGLVSQKRDWPWAETFDVMPTDPLPFGSGQVDVHDDLKREVAFYDVALKAVLEAKDKCEEAGISFSRPDDFFAEMVKTDGMLQTSGR
jgi:rRNA-processing protein EBP2